MIFIVDKFKFLNIPARIVQVSNLKKGWEVEGKITGIPAWQTVQLEFSYNLLDAECVPSKKLYSIVLKFYLEIEISINILITV